MSHYLNYGHNMPYMLNVIYTSMGILALSNIYIYISLLSFNDVDSST